MRAGVLIFDILVSAFQSHQLVPGIHAKNIGPRLDLHKLRVNPPLIAVNHVFAGNVVAGQCQIGIVFLISDFLERNPRHRLLGVQPEIGDENTRNRRHQHQRQKHNRKKGYFQKSEHQFSRFEGGVQFSGIFMRKSELFTCNLIISTSLLAISCRTICHPFFERLHTP